MSEIINKTSIETKILNKLERIENKLDNFEGFYSPSKKEIEELNNSNNSENLSEIEFLKNNQ